jgi:hypothetical protein
MSQKYLTFAKKHAISSAAKISEDMRQILRSLDELTDEHGLNNNPLTVVQELSGLSHISFMCGFTKLIKQEIINILSAGTLIVNYGLLNRHNDRSIESVAGHPKRRFGGKLPPKSSRPSIECRSCNCGECEPEQVYQCDGCGAIVAYCDGADDKFFEYCDRCVLAMSDLGIE